MNNIKKINIADILRNKPRGIKLYSPAFGVVTLDRILGNKNYCIQILDIDNNHHILTEFGQISIHGKCMLFPSQNMRDWEKFAWKKGDVLATDINTYCIFDSWKSNDYLQFRAKYIYRNSDGYFYPDEVRSTCNWTRVKENDIIEYYINIIERSKGDRLNLKTLEIEKPNPQFNDGDILVLDSDKNHFKTILLYQSNIKDNYKVYSFLNTRTEYLYFESILVDDRKARLATNSEKQQLFDALAKENKVWNVEKKAIINLPKKHEFKPFDKVLCRNSKDDIWEIDLFSRLTRKEIDFTKSDKYMCIGDLWMYCIPYNDQTSHLLGTNDDWEEG